MRTKIVNVVIIISFVTAVVLMAVIIWRSDRNRIQQNKVADKMIMMNDYLSFLERSTMMKVINEGFRVPHFIITDMNNRNTLVDDIVKSPKLVLKYSSSGCEQCILSELELIANDCQISKKDIIILIAQQHIRGLKVFNEKNKYGYDMYTTDYNSIPYDETNNLFLFVLDSSMCVKDFFIPERTLPYISRAYYNAINSKYFRDRNIN